jgi:ParB family transcriptional regulator, chromosome partitioning protein
VSAKAKRPSPILSTASAMIDEASDRLITATSRFRHTFEANLDAIEPDPNQPRKIFSDEETAALAATMEERGQLQPILVRHDPRTRGRWFIVAGERRWRAAKLNGWSTILAIEHNGDPEIVSLLENLQRVDLTPVEEARGLQKLIQGKGWTQDQTAEALGRSKSEISGTLRILTLPNDVLTAVLTSELEIPKNVLTELARVEGRLEQEYLIKLARQGRLTVRAIRAVREGRGSRESGIGITGRDAGGRSYIGLSLRALDKVASDVRAVRESGKSIAESEKAHLERLRREIDDLLHTLEPPTGDPGRAGVA